MTRKALLRIVKALLSKTVENGCTEGEALAAMAKASAMIAEHELTDADLSFGGEKVQAAPKQQSDRNRARFYMAPAVSRFCNCEQWTDGSRENIVFCGLEGDTVFAHWLLDTLEYFVLRELAAFLRRTRKPGMPSVRRIESNGFVMGCASRIVQRLREARPVPVNAPGRGLVIARNALILDHMKALGVVLSRDPLGRVKADNSAFDAGAAAGEHANFNRPIAGNGPALQIEDNQW